MSSSLMLLQRLSRWLLARDQHQAFFGDTESTGVSRIQRGRRHVAKRWATGDESFSIPMGQVPIERNSATKMSPADSAARPDEAHEKDSNAMSFETVVSRAFQEAAKLAGAQLLEPVMAVEVVTPEESLGTSKVVDAHAPLSTLFGYVPGLRGLSRGRANATMHCAHSTAVPPAIAQQTVKDRRRSRVSGSAVFRALQVVAVGRL